MDDLRPSSVAERAATQTFDTPPCSTTLYQRRKGTDQELVEFGRVKNRPSRLAGWGRGARSAPSKLPWSFLCSRIFLL